MENVCPKCKGTGRIKDETGIHTCFDCLASGKLDNYTKDLKTLEEGKFTPKFGQKKEIKFPLREAGSSIY
jgi:hypothetical protein